MVQAQDPFRMGEGSASLTELQDNTSATGEAVTRAHGALQRSILQLRIMATSDVHANLLSYDYAANRSLHGVGLATMTALMAKARAEAKAAWGDEAVLLLDNGDFLQGTALADLRAQEQRRRGHPVIAAMNALGYDAATLGNHEFNYGLAALERALAEARFPVVSANVLRKGGPLSPIEARGLVPPYTLLTRQLRDAGGLTHQLSIGVLGLTPPETALWDKMHLSGRIEIRPMLETAQEWLPKLRAAGADLVICLAHIGLDRCGMNPANDGLIADLAALPGMDALVLGHSHATFPKRNAAAHSDRRIDAQAGRISGIPVVQPGYFGSHLGIIDLKLAVESGPALAHADGLPCPRPKARYKVLDAQVQAQNVSEVAAGLSSAELRRHAAPLRRALSQDHRMALDWARRSLGQTEVPLASAFSQVADTAAMRLLGLANLDHLEGIVAGTHLADLPRIAAVTPHRSGGAGGPLNFTEIAAGRLSIRHILDLHPFPNTFCAQLITGAELREELERAVSIFQQIKPGGLDQRLMDPGFPSYAFASIVGVSYGVDLSQPARYNAHGQLIRPRAHRVTKLQRGGRPVQNDDRFIMATDSFRASGGLGGVPPAADRLIGDGTQLCSEILRLYLQRIGLLRAEALELNERWQLCQLPGASVLYEAGPNALLYKSEAAHLRPEAAGLNEDGFHLVRLHL
ncbi:5'-nucleotidase C-terminal domain-containing protein [Xinfangfangia sp. CPCC 101601]|uniref:5'-nucleotidase C-terminal domain-containing protein n=1 Tax=Pseudogemmobacter lacusdianii TaxID=3069608 RepID=A0ABU0VYI2_9RHOB|nr:5'-nucleotidase C-terminal domain-containing protein [Xinfangfangia sp. CPCC 101601]MDQ2066822.1 5'-nucleotidase C-terminal domain-containing protein [Xinfangfangia sp. CPCC 101601]